jgi:hypothetical protein
MEVEAKMRQALFVKSTEHRFERGALFCDKKDLAAPRRALGDQIRDRLTLAGARRAADDAVLTAQRAADGPLLCRIGIENKKFFVRETSIKLAWIDFISRTANALSSAWVVGNGGDHVMICRLVVDTGIHAKRWTREQGVQFFVERNGSNPIEVISEVDRYCSWPGQACGYKVGQSDINRQRERAKTALGQKYDLKAFDDIVVLGGNVPLDVLAKNVDEYIRTTKA